MEYLETHKEVIRLEYKLCNGIGCVQDSKLVEELKTLLKIANSSNDTHKIKCGACGNMVEKDKWLGACNECR